MRRLGLLVISVAATASCRVEPPALDVGGVRYSESELLGLSGERRQVLATLTGFGHAVATGTLDELGDPLVSLGRQRRLGELLRAQGVLDSMAVGEDALANHYLGNPEEELTVRHLIILSPRYETEAARRDARQKAEGALARIRAGEDFPRVAAEVSEEPGAEGRQGLLEPGREGAWVREFWNAARALEVGEVSGVVETQYGFHVLRLENREIVPFEEARSAVTLQVAGMLGVRPSEEAPVPAPADLRIPDEELLRSRVHDPSADDDDEAASWSAGAITLGEIRDQLAALERDDWEAALDPRRSPSLRDVVDAAVRWREAAAQAEAHGHRVGDAHEASLRRGWTDRAERWAEVFGFRQGMGAGDLRTASLRGLGATTQNATVARLELEERAPLIHRRYGTLGPLQEEGG